MVTNRDANESTSLHNYAEPTTTAKLNDVLLEGLAQSETGKIYTVAVYILPTTVIQK